MRDHDVRKVLRASLETEHAGEPDTLIIDELGVRQGESRADLVVINGSMSGYEIKSERDTLDRLPRQVLVYEQVFDAVTLVAAVKHLKAAEQAVPPSWGIMSAVYEAKTLVLRKLRPASENTRTQECAIVQLLWREEAIDVLRQLGRGRNALAKPRSELWRAIVSVVPPGEIRRIVREKIKARGDWRPEMRRARGSGSSPTVANAQDSQSNLSWLLSVGSPDHLD